VQEVCDDPLIFYAQLSNFEQDALQFLGSVLRRKSKSELIMIPK
jgi:hypothetical protein